MKTTAFQYIILAAWSLSLIGFILVDVVKGETGPATNSISLADTEGKIASAINEYKSDPELKDLALRATSGAFTDVFAFGAAVFGNCLVNSAGKRDPVTDKYPPEAIEILKRASDGLSIMRIVAASGHPDEVYAFAEKLRKDQIRKDQSKWSNCYFYIKRMYIAASLAGNSWASVREVESYVGRAIFYYDNRQADGGYMAETAYAESVGEINKGLSRATKQDARDALIELRRTLEEKVGSNIRSPGKSIDLASVLKFIEKIASWLPESDRGHKSTDIDQYLSEQQRRRAQCQRQVDAMVDAAAATGNNLGFAGAFMGCP